MLNHTFYTKVLIIIFLSLFIVLSTDSYYVFAQDNNNDATTCQNSDCITELAIKNADPSICNTMPAYTSTCLLNFAKSSSEIEYEIRLKACELYKEIKPKAYVSCITGVAKTTKNIDACKLATKPSEKSFCMSSIESELTSKTRQEKSILARERAKNFTGKLEFGTKEFYYANSVYIALIALFIFIFFSFPKNYIRKPAIFNIIILGWIMFFGSSKLALKTIDLKQSFVPSPDAFYGAFYNFPDWLIIVGTNLANMLIALIITIVASYFYMQIKKIKEIGNFSLGINIIFLAFFSLIDIFLLIVTGLAST